MIAPISSFAASPALGALRGLTSMRMAGGEYKPWDVKQEGGQMDSGWGTGEDAHIFLNTRPLLFFASSVFDTLRTAYLLMYEDIHHT